MGEKQGRSVSRIRDEKWGRVRRRLEVRSKCIRGCCLAVLAVGVVAAVGQGPFSGQVLAQDTPAKNKAAARPEAPPESGPAEAGQEPAPVTAEALSLRYRFIERYSTTEDPTHPELITQYRVGIRETQKIEREKAQGAPDRTEISRQTIYTERAAQVGKLGEMLSAVRRYDRFAMKQGATGRPSKPPLFEGLTIYLRRQAGQKPKVLSLTADRPLREFELSEITKQVIVPQLTALLPPAPKRVGDRWSISRTASHCLVGEIPEAEEFELTGTLIEVRKAAAGPSLTAVIGVAGQMNLSLGLSSLRAKLEFVFDPAPIAAPATGSAASLKGDDDSSGKIREKRESGLVDARGKITRVLMLWAASDALPDGEGRLKQTLTYELNLERRFTSTANEPPGGLNAPLAVPEPPPKADESNSWVVFDDPQGRFHFFHPQGFSLSPRMIDPNSVEFIEENPGIGQDVFIIQLAPGNADPEADRKFRDAKQFQREIDAFWAKTKHKTLRGTSDWLPEADWAPRKVYRRELGVITQDAEEGGPVQRIFIDNYLILSSRNECFRAQSMTVRNDHVSLRNQAESMIKSFRFGPWDGKPMVTTAAPGTQTIPPR